MKKTFISLFGGIGGFDKALTDNGWNCVFYNDFDKYAVKTYNKNFGGNYEPRDIKTLLEKEIPDHTLLCGGFPCQSFSIAGKRKGFEDTRGTLFFELCRIIKSKRPRFLLLENVRGLLSHDKGKTFGTILQSLDDLGYDVQWQVFNSKYYTGQNRERVYIFGSFRNEPFKRLFPIEEKSRVIIEGLSTKGKKTFNCLTKAGGTKRLHDSTIVFSLQPRTGKGKGGSGTLFKEDGTTYCLDKGNSQAFMDCDSLRYLSPLECERLQGFPDNWTQGVSKTQRYCQLGNAVTVPVVAEIIKKINEVYD